jgi:hypothetical protein
MYMRKHVMIVLLSLLVVAFFVPAFSSTQAQEVDKEVEVRAVNGTPVDVPTVAQSSENFLYAVTGIIISILTLVSWAIKNGLLDTILTKRQKEKLSSGIEGTIIGLKKAVEDKELIRYSLKLLFAKTTDENDRADIKKKLDYVTEQIVYTQKQIDYYTDKLGINPDNNRTLPREDLRLVNEVRPHLRSPTVSEV